MIDSTALLADLQGQVRLLEADLADQLVALPAAAELLRDEYDAERKARRTAVAWPAWRDTQLTQVAVAWVLGTVFLRWSEDNGLIEPVLSGPGDRLAVAEDAQLDHYRRHLEHNDGDWLAEQFEVLRTTDAGTLLFDHEHNPMYWLPISHDAAKVLVAFWRRTDGERLRHDFTDPSWDTRFLGDLYQGISAESRDRYSLLQTAPFIEQYILDHTLDLAIDELGVENVRLIDPACGSGHFLLSAFDRIIAKSREESPSADVFAVIRHALDVVHGVDVNPFAVAIARFRLLVAALQKLEICTFADAARIHVRPIVATADSLLMLSGQQQLVVEIQGGVQRLRADDGQQFADVSLMKPHSYSVVVLNPPYSAVDDEALRVAYRSIYGSCFGKYTLTIPFIELAFRLLGSRGYMGQITSNSFMKRKFGKRLIEEYLPTVNLTHVVDSSGIPVPGAGVTTTILFGRGHDVSPKATVRVLSRMAGEPGKAPGPAWRAILAQTDGGATESVWISGTDMERDGLARHPWTLSSSTAAGILLKMGSEAKPLASLVRDIGMTVFTGEDGVYLIRSEGPLARRLERYTTAAVAGDDVEDYEIDRTTLCIVPNGEHGAVRELDQPLLKHFWPFRRLLRERVYFGKKIHERDIQWFDLSLLFGERRRGREAVTFAAMATHASFALDREQRLFKQSAPVIKLALDASQSSYVDLCALLNTSPVAFWLRQNCHSYGSGARSTGERKATVEWENYLDFATSRVEEIPIPRRGGRWVSHAERLAPELVAGLCGVEDRKKERDGFAALESDLQAARRVQISFQEEFDWMAYERYGLLSRAEADEVLLPIDAVPPPINLGQRAFEIALVRQAQDQGIEPEPSWFRRHNATLTNALPSEWTPEYRSIVENRIRLIGRRVDIARIERPECKRRWIGSDFPGARERALRLRLLQTVDVRRNWFAEDDRGMERPTVRTIFSLADELAASSEFVSIAAVWAGVSRGRPDAPLSQVLAWLIEDEHVPFLAAYRFNGDGLKKWAGWNACWMQQRLEDDVVDRLGTDSYEHPVVKEAVVNDFGATVIPERYSRSDYCRDSYWVLRGKLDLKQERLISYPAASRDGDGSLLLGWAGWDHQEQAQALATLIGERRSEDGWSAERVIPLLVGLLEVLPWVHQWHGEADSVYGAAPGDIYDGFLDAQLNELRLSRDDLISWRPTGRVDVAPFPRRNTSRAPGSDRMATPRVRRAAPDPAHLDAILTAARNGPLSNEQIRDLTGLDAAGARAAAQHLVADGRLATSGQRRGMRYLLP